ncbi:MAG: 2Fe-2S iron-sulfur cluster binding domain-containing protein [Rhodospirillaceae bacterium]|nr:2Fe-2S iron-sulfur cluster binding domain-containing protein [Rhodospirillaceae bacterium]
MKVEIVTYRNGETTVVEYDYQRRSDDEKPMVLDVLLQAQVSGMPDLAFRYGCRARNCGVCTVDINGRPRLACRARIREGDTISAMATLPVLSDLVVRRDSIARQMRGRLPAQVSGNDLNVEASAEYHTLTACVECYACLHGCPMHAQNLEPQGAGTAGTLEAGEGYRWGNPFSLLKLQMRRLDPLVTEPEKEAVVAQAVELGLEVCIDCPGCKCGIGIDLKNKVVKALLDAAEQNSAQSPPD